MKAIPAKSPVIFNSCVFDQNYGRFLLSKLYRCSRSSTRPFFRSQFLYAFFSYYFHFSDNTETISALLATCKQPCATDFKRVPRSIVSLRITLETSFTAGALHFRPSSDLSHSSLSPPEIDYPFLTIYLQAPFLHTPTTFFRPVFHLNHLLSPYLSLPLPYIRTIRLAIDL